MTTFRAILVCLVTLVGCAETHEVTAEPVAGAAAQRIAVGVGVVEQALTACYAAKSKIKARYGCVTGWVETNEITNTSGTCPQNRDYLIFKTINQPPATVAANFEVDYRDHTVGGGWRFRHYVQCRCDNTPCIVIAQP